MTLLYMDKQSHQERASLMTITQLLNASAMFLGSGLGFFLLGSGAIQGASYYTLFLLSSACRLLPLLVLPFLGDSRIGLPKQLSRLILWPLRSLKR